jgi:Na+/phosphate symporter
VPDLIAKLHERLTALDQLRKEHRWSELITAVTDLEQAADTSLEKARAVHRAVKDEPLERREELRGLLKSYQAMTREQGRAELPLLVELYQRAYDLLWTAPCDLRKAEAAAMRYVSAAQDGQGS